ncbi:MAG: non-ribosomal peptide synthetase [Bacilli bacterium]|nr:non-ribosomal peptide synthetase [Bacilli bacterium]
MKYTNLGQFSSIKPYIEDKLSRLSNLDRSFDSLFNMMFENEPNILFEENTGFRIKRYTYGECKANVSIIAKNIKAKYPGAEYDSVIGLYLDNSHTWIETFWAILMCGFRPLLLNMRLSDDSLEYALDITNAAGIISKGKIFSCPTLLESDLYKENDQEVNTKFGEELFVMSSGTSENIKICAYSAEEIIKILLQSKEIILSSKRVQKFYDGELKLLAFLPFYHIFGFVANYLWFGFFARTFVKLNDLNPLTIQNTIRRHHVTHIFAVPLFWQKTYDAAIREIKNKGDKTYNKFLKGMKLASKPLIGKLITKYAFKQVREQLFGESVNYMITGGSMIDKKVLTFFNSIGYHLSNGYGMSEIGITSVELSENHKTLNSASIGKPLPGLEYSINENGELLVKGDTLAKYIIENEEIHKRKDEPFLTHDLAYKDGDRYYLQGRQDDLVVSITGENLNPNIIEEKLMIDNVISLCLINGRDNSLPILLVSISKYLSAEDANQLTKDLVIKITEHNLNSQIGKVVLVSEPFIGEDEFKINRKKLEEKYYSNALTLYVPKLNKDEFKDEISNKIRELFAKTMNRNINDIHMDTDFFLDIGGTSIDYAVMMAEIQETYNASLSDSEKPLTTIQDISQYVKERL